MRALSWTTGHTSSGATVHRRVSLLSEDTCAGAALQQARDHYESGITFRSNAVSWDNCVAVSVTDASFAQETVIEHDGKEKFHRTQKAFMVLLVDPRICTDDGAGCHIYCWRSLTNKRVCRATLQGEARGLLSGTEMGDRLRAIIADLRG